MTIYSADWMMNNKSKKVPSSFKTGQKTPAAEAVRSGMKSGKTQKNHKVISNINKPHPSDTF